MENLCELACDLPLMWYSSMNNRPLWTYLSAQKLIFPDPLTFCLSLVTIHSSSERSSPFQWYIACRLSPNSFDFLQYP